MKKASFLILIFLFMAINATSQTKDERVFLGRKSTEEQLKSSLHNKKLHNWVNNKRFIIKDSVMAVEIAETILFDIYGKNKIIKERPYEIYLINSYWVIQGTLPKGYLGGSFLIIIDARNCKIIRITHGK